MVRPPLSRLEHERGQRLGMLLREARGPRSMAEIAAVSGVPAETLRKIETGRIATPAFFTVAALAGALGLAPEEIGQARHEPPEARSAWPVARGAAQPARPAPAGDLGPAETGRTTAGVILGRYQAL